MPTLVRRFVVLAAVMFWQGGFTFYGAVVVPVGSEILGSHLSQGWITRSVTNYLNLVGLVTLGIWAWDLAAVKDRATWRRRFRWGVWGLLVLTLCLLAWLHLRLDDYLDPETLQLVDRTQFRSLHIQYLNVSTVQWVGGLVLLGTTLAAWRSEDERSTAAQP